MTWTVARVGFAPIKGTRHRELPEVVLTKSGPVGDRRFCLVDPVRRRALRTVETPQLVAVTVDWRDPELSCTFPDGSRVDEAVMVDEQSIEFDYWGRQVSGRRVTGPWAAAFGRYLGAEVELVACAPGDVVFGDSLSLITTGSLAALSTLIGRSIDPARLRATAVVDDHAEGRTLTDPVESDWIGRQLTIGTATVRVTGPIARCAVIDIHPVTGERDGNLLRTLARAARTGEQFLDPIFGVQATVMQPGLLRPGDRAALIEADTTVTGAAAREAANKSPR
ncbi:MOSC domain-containing protein [Microlunatus elymi]|uniref:MOSC domain-containing protein n=1 Tax=Microlunatus elymi TaxID=2596828 RepID=A0A516PV10_9ACTN|nr:MOSC N-terminal beta barrel domain-containing protein [Microlunatus elymi]QDP95026.1 MOSC domain-containing protein [Microlunatus elymi]